MIMFFIFLSGMLATGVLLAALDNSHRAPWDVR